MCFLTCALPCNKVLGDHFVSKMIKGNFSQVFSTQKVFVLIVIPLIVLDSFCCVFFLVSQFNPNASIKS